MKRYYDSSIYPFSPESLDHDDYIIATYYFSQECRDHLKTIGNMCLESSTGGWMDYPHETKELRKNLSTKVIGYYPIPTYDGNNKKSSIAQLAFSMKGGAGWTGSISAMLSSVAGNILKMPGEVKLLDIYFPKSFTNHFKGPVYGVEGIRKVVGIYDRPLVNMMIKPKVGLTQDLIEDIVYEASLGGVDHIKDDEISTEVYNCSFEERVKAVMTGLKRAYEKTGNKVIYTANVSDNGNKIIEKAKRALELGVSGLMVNYFNGYETLKQMAEDEKLDIPILFHPTGNVSHGAIDNVVLSKVSRLCGADIYIPGSPWGKWSNEKDLETTIRSGQMMSSDFYHIKPTFVLQSSVAGKVPIFIEDYGKDIILGGGGAIHGHPDGVTAGVKAIIQAIELTINQIPLEEGANEYEELAKSLNRHPVFIRPEYERY